MTATIELTETDVRKLVFDHLREKLNIKTLKADDVVIEVKSKQNFKSEWEAANFRVKVIHSVF